jgi:hypothetical protein
MRATTGSRPRIALAALAAATALAAAGQARAQEAGGTQAATIENVRVGYRPENMEVGSSPKSLAEEHYKVGSWTPVWVDIQGGGGPFRGQVELIVPDDDATPTSIRFPAFVPKGELRTLALQTRPGTDTAEFSVQLRDEQGRPVGQPRRVVPLGPLEPSTRLLLTTGEKNGVEGVLTLERYKGGRSRTPELVVAPLRELPGVWYALDGVETIVLDTGHRPTVDLLGAGGDRVLKEWVAQGGHLIVTMGEEWPSAQESLGPILPAEPTDPLSLTDVSPVESFAGHVEPGLEGPLHGRKLEGWEARKGVPLASSLSSPLVVRGAYGFGLVTVVGLDMGQPAFAKWKDRRLFWEKVLGLRGRESDDGFALASSRGALIQSAAPELAARMHRSLESFPGVKIVPFGWVAFFVFAYILLIGPLDYLFLKRVARRMELTWITFPLIVLAVSIAAYAGAYAIKGSDLRVNKVDAVDYDQSTGLIRGNTWMTVFSPANRDYGLSIAPLGPTLEPGSKADLRSQTLSWFGSPEPVLGGSGRIAFGNAGYAYGPAGRPESIEGIRIPIWSTKSFTGRWAGSAGAKLIESELEVVGGDRVSGSIRNLTGETLENAQLFYGRHVYDLGTIRPGGIVRVTPTRTESMSANLGRLARGLDRRRAARGGRSELANARGNVLRAAMFHDAMGAHGAAAPNLSLRSLDLSVQVSELHRPMLVADVAAPAASLTLEQAPAGPEVDQLTVLRVVLSLGAGGEGSKPGSPR